MPYTVVLAEVELASELPDEFCHPVYFLWFFQGPGYPGRRCWVMVLMEACSFGGVLGEVAAA